MSMSDQTFTKNFVAMIGGFIVLTIILLILAYIMAGPTTMAMSEMKRAEGEAIMAAKMQPIGTIKVKKAGEAAEPVQVAALSGDAVYASSCVACHGEGVAGAPKFGDAAQWTDRIAQGMETLVSHAIDGYQGKAGYMPAKGGNAKLSDEEVTAAVEHMTAAVQ